MPEHILVTGATGTVGSRVVRQLLKRTETDGEKPRIIAAVHNAEKASDLKAAGAHVVEMSFDKPGTVEQAFGNVDKLFLLTPPDLSTVQASETAIAAAEAAGVKYVVKLSAFGAEIEPPISLLRLHRSAELLIMGSGMDWTFLRPNGFMQNFEQFAGSINSGSGIALPLGDAAVSYVDVDDIAAVAVEVLLGREIEHSGKAYDLTGPEALTGEQVASTLSRVLSRSVAFTPTTDEQTQQMLTSNGVPAPLAQALDELYQMYRRNQASAVSNAVGAITGRSARSFELYLMDNRAAYSD